jgi:cytochrome c oxidase subunit 1
MQWLNVTSTAGASVLFFGLLVAVINLAVSLKSDSVAGDNPWGSRGFEWYTTSPPAPHNFEGPPEFAYSVHDYPVAVRPTRELRRMTAGPPAITGGRLG